MFIVQISTLNKCPLLAGDRVPYGEMSTKAGFTAILGCFSFVCLLFVWLRLTDVLTRLVYSLIISYRVNYKPNRHLLNTETRCQSRVYRAPKKSTVNICAFRSPKTMEFIVVIIFVLSQSCGKLCGFSVCARPCRLEVNTHCVYLCHSLDGATDPSAAARTT